MLVRNRVACAERQRRWRAVSGQGRMLARWLRWRGRGIGQSVMDKTSSRGSDSPVVSESLWRPRGPVRLAAGLAAAVGLPILVTNALLGGYVRTFPALGYIACIALAAMLGRLIAAVVAVAVSAALASYFLVKARTVPPITHAHAVDFSLFLLVGMCIA